MGPCGQRLRPVGACLRHPPSHRAGIDRADSWTTDGHNWLNHTYDGAAGHLPRAAGARQCDEQRCGVFHRRLRRQPEESRHRVFASCAGHPDLGGAAHPRSGRRRQTRGAPLSPGSAACHRPRAGRFRNPQPRGAEPGAGAARPRREDTCALREAAIASAETWFSPTVWQDRPRFGSASRRGARRTGTSTQPSRLLGRLRRNSARHGPHGRAAARRSGRFGDTMGGAPKASVKNHNRFPMPLGLPRHLSRARHENFIHQSASVIGDVRTGRDCSIWCNAVVRGDVNRILIGDWQHQDFVMLPYLAPPRGQARGFAADHRRSCHRRPFGNPAWLHHRQ